MKKIMFIASEFKTLISQHKLYFLTPLLILLAIVAILFFKLGPSLILAFIYAGV